MKLVTVREFATLTTRDVPSTLDLASICDVDFAWLAERAGAPADGQARCIQIESSRSLRVLNYVGVIRTPSGLQIEILPKHTEEVADIRSARRLLFRLISAGYGIPPKIADEADLEVLKHPLTEWLAAMFLDAVARLLKKGLRQDYQRIEASELFLRGRLDLARQLRAGPGSLTRFQIQHDVFTLDRPENRLIRLAVERVAKATAAPTTWRLARELSLALEEVPLSRDISQDFARWSDDRLLAHYTAVRRLCELVLTDQTPFAVSGSDAGISMLFPMEKLFERFVARAVRAMLPFDYEVTPQDRAYHLCTWRERPWFELRPDLVVRRGQDSWVLDAKWKILHGNRNQAFGLSQADFYQMHAYGQAYLRGRGNLFLVYPKAASFPPLHEPFEMVPDLRLHVVPIDLDTSELSLPGILETTAA